MKVADKVTDKVTDKNESGRRIRKHGEITVDWIERRRAWYYRAMIDGRRYEKSTGVYTDSSAGRAQALKKAKEIDFALRHGSKKKIASVVARPGFSTVGDLLDRWEQAGPIKSARAVSARFERYVRAALKSPHPRNEKLDLALNGETLRRWITEQAKSGRGEDGIRSDLASLKSVLQPSVLHAYADLELPPVENFRSVVFSSRRREGKGAVKRAAFVCLAPEVLARMEKAAERLRQSADVEDRRVWAAFVLMRWCGLRNRETIQLRWSWIRQGKKSKVVEFSKRDLGNGEFYYPKGRDGVVPIREDLLKQLRAAFPDEKEFVIPRKNETDALDVCQRGINRFAEKYITRRGKKISYNLRMQFGAEVAMRSGLEVASRMLRHASTQTTWDYYHDLVTEPDPL